MVPDIYSWNAMMTAYDRGEQWERAISLLSEIKNPDVISYSAAISACGKGYQWQHALALFHEADSQFEPNAFLVCAAIHACAWQWEQAFSCFQRLSTSSFY